MNPSDSRDGPARFRLGLIRPGWWPAPPPLRVSRSALFLFRCMPPLLPRETRWDASVLPSHRQRPSPS